MRIRPLQGQVLVEVLPVSDNVNGIVLPEKAQEKPYKAVVREVGPWAQKRKSGALIPYDFRKGNTVVVSPYAGTQLHRDFGERFRLVRWDQILAVVG